MSSNTQSMSKSKEKISKVLVKKDDNLKDDEKNVIKSSDELKKSEENVSQRSADLEISDGKSSDDKMIIKKTKSGQTDDKKEMKGERSAVHGKRGTTDPKSLNLSVSSIESNHSSTNSTDSRLNPITYLKVLDNYVSGKHWHLGFEYVLHSLSAIFWSLIIPFFVLYEISDKCRDKKWFHMHISVMIASITAIELVIVIIVWYLTNVYQFVNKTKVCLAVIICHIVIGSLNLLMAIASFASNHCYQMGGSDADKDFDNYLKFELKYSSLLKYDIKTLALLHSLIAINVWMCAMLLAIKRNDFKYYVLWRKGLLNDYLMLDED